jgi:surface antigen
MVAQHNKEVWPVKSLTALGKLFLTISIASVSVPHLAHAQANYQDNVSGPLNPGSNYVEFIANFMNWHGGFLSREDKKVYQQALMIMLENVPVGQTMEWYSETNPEVSGVMRVVYGYQTSNGYCRVYQSLIKKDGNARQIQEYACRSEVNPRWQFYNK